MRFVTKTMLVGESSIGSKQGGIHSTSEEEESYTLYNDHFSRTISSQQH